MDSNVEFQQSLGYAEKSVLAYIEFFIPNSFVGKNKERNKKARINVQMPLFDRPRMQEVVRAQYHGYGMYTDASLNRPE